MCRDIRGISFVTTIWRIVEVYLLFALFCSQTTQYRLTIQKREVLIFTTFFFLFRNEEEEKEEKKDKGQMEGIFTY